MWPSVGERRVWVYDVVWRMFEVVKVGVQSENSPRPHEYNRDDGET